MTEDASTAPGPPQERVCFVGDSYVQGIGDPDGIGWTGRVVRAALARGHPVSAFNLGIRRETGPEIEARWLAECAPRLVAGAANRVVLSFGTNDATIEGRRRRVAHADSVACLERMAAGARARGWAVVVIGPPPTLDDRRNAAARRLCRAFAGCCDRLRVPYLPLIDRLAGEPAWLAELAAGDRAHPGADGYGLMAECVDAWPHWWYRAARGEG